MKRTVQRNALRDLARVGVEDLDTLVERLVLPSRGGLGRVEQPSGLGRLDLELAERRRHVRDLLLAVL